MSKNRGLKTGTYLDDRTIWTKGVNAARILKEVMAAGERVDTAIFLPEKIAKIECFVTQQLRDELWTELDMGEKKPTSGFLMLGTNYGTTNMSKSPIEQTGVDGAM